MHDVSHEQDVDAVVVREEAFDLAGQEVENLLLAGVFGWKLLGKDGLSLVGVDHGRLHGFGFVFNYNFQNQCENLINSFAKDTDSN